MVGARLERHVEGRTGRVLATGRERGALGVRLPRTGVKALADHAPVPDHDGTHERVGTRPPAPPRRQLERPPEVDGIALGGERLDRRGGHGRRLDSPVNLPALSSRPEARGAIGRASHWGRTSLILH